MTDKVQDIPTRPNVAFMFPTDFVCRYEQSRIYSFLKTNSRKCLMTYCAYGERPIDTDKGKLEVKFSELIRYPSEWFDHNFWLPAKRRKDKDSWSFFRQAVVFGPANGKGYAYGYTRYYIFYYALPKNKDSGFDETQYQQDATFRQTKELSDDALKDDDEFQWWSEYPKQYAFKREFYYPPEDEDKHDEQILCIPDKNIIQMERERKWEDEWKEERKTGAGETDKK